MKNLFLIVIFISTTFIIVGQNKENPYSRWYLKPAGGINIPITTLLNGETTDNLFEYDDYTYYWQIISASFFFHKNWGIEFTFQGSSSNKIAGRSARFNAEMSDSYSNYYYVTPNSSAQYDDSFNVIGGNIERGYLGIVYRIEKPRIILLPKLFIGVTSFRTDWANVHLKEKGSNTVLTKYYSSGKRPNDHFTIAPAFTFGYRLSKRLILNSDILYSFFKTDIEFIETTQNKYTGENIENTINYIRAIHTLSIGIGLIIELKPAPNKR